MTLKYLITVLLFVLLRCNSYAQSSKDSTYFFKQAIFAECLGQGEGLFSINYERCIYHLGVWGGITARSGFGYFPGDSVGGRYQKGAWSFPFVATCYLGHKRHFLTLGAGYTVILTNYFVDSFTTPLQIYRPYEDEFTFKIGYCFYGLGGAFFEIYPMLHFSSPNHSAYRSYYSLGFSLGLGWNEKNITQQPKSKDSN